MILVSACLLGLCCRYDGRSKKCPEVLKLTRGQHGIVPVCPEQLGGLPTPRPPAVIAGGDGFDVLAGTARVIVPENREDVTDAFLSGAEQCLRLVRIFHIKRAVLKARSPSCGLKCLTGVTAAALALQGLEMVEF